jgi:predicted AlkP superfamily pyrophosphatase or phosphodiesterase
VDRWGPVLLLNRMRLGIHLWILLFVLIPLTGITAESHVILITIDGFPASALNDPKASIPTLRALARQGVSAEGMRVSNPTMTWPNHTTLVTGMQARQHSVLFNGVMTRSGTGVMSVDGRKDKKELVVVPTLFDLAHTAGRRTAGINWPCTRNSGTLDDDFPDVPQNLLFTTPRLREELVGQGVLADPTDETFATLSGPARDTVWKEAACHLIRTRKPHFLLLHLLNMDGTHHKYGPGSPASYTALTLADYYIRDVLSALSDAGIRDQTTLLIVADHGFAMAEKVILPNVLLKQAGLLETTPAGVITRTRAQLVPEGGTGMLYLTQPATRDEDRKKVLELLLGKEGIAEILTPDRFAELGLPTPAENPGMADFLLVAKDGYGVSGLASGTDYVQPTGGLVNAGYHGYLSTHPKMNALFIATGRGIRRQPAIGLVDNIDVAPTLARLLGLSFAKTDGKVLTQILE